MSSTFVYLFQILVIVALTESCMPPNMNGDPQQMIIAQQQPCPIHDNQHVYPINSQTISSQPLAQVIQSQMPSSSQFNEQLNTLYKLAYVRWNFYKQLMDLYQSIYSNNLQNNGLNTVMQTPVPLPYSQQSYGQLPYYQQLYDQKINYQQPNYQQPYNQQPNYQQLYNQQPNYKQLYNQLLNDQQPYSPQICDSQQSQTEAQPDLKNEFIKHQTDEKQPIEDDEPNYQSDYEDDIQRSEYNVDKQLGEDELKKKQSEIEQESSAEREIKKVKAKVSELLIKDEEDDDDDDDNDDYDDDSNYDGDNINNDDDNDEKKDHEDYHKIREEEELLQQQNQSDVLKTKKQNLVLVKKKLEESNQQEITTNMISQKTKPFNTQLVKPIMSFKSPNIIELPSKNTIQDNKNTPPILLKKGTNKK